MREWNVKYGKIGVIHRDDDRILMSRGPNAPSRIMLFMRAVIRLGSPVIIAAKKGML